MKTRHWKILSLGFLAAIFMAGSCKQPEPIPPRGEYDGGYFVLNEGQFMHDNASLSFIKEDFSEKEDSVYAKVNDGASIGDVAQSLFLNGDKAYIVVNNSNKIIVANRWHMHHLGEIVAFIRSPRQMIKISDRYGMVSNWGEVFDSNWSDVDDDYVAWVDLENDVVTDTLHVGLGPTYMVFNGGNVYVSLTGVAAPNNKIAVIDPSTKSVISYITVAERPGRIINDESEKIWVLCSGNPAWTGAESAGHLIHIDPATNTIMQDLAFHTSQHPQYLTYDGDHHKLYYILDNKIYSVETSQAQIPSTPFIDLNADIQTPYGMDYYDGKLFVTDAQDYRSPGKVVIYDVTNGQKIGSFVTGYLPNSVKYNKWIY